MIQKESNAIYLNICSEFAVSLMTRKNDHDHCSWDFWQTCHYISLWNKLCCFLVCHVV